MVFPVGARFSLVLIIVTFAFICWVELADEKSVNTLNKVPLVSQIINQRERVEHKARVTTLNHQIPDFSLLVASIFNSNDFEENNLKPYVRYYQNVIKAFPQMGEGYQILGFCYYQMKDYSQAKEYFLKASLLSQDSFYVYYNLGLSYFQLKEYDRAVAVLKQSVELRPEKTLQSIIRSKAYQQIFAKADLGGHLKQLKIKDHYRDAAALLRVSQQMQMNPRLLEAPINVKQLRPRVL